MREQPKAGEPPQTTGGGRAPERQGPTRETAWSARTSRRLATALALAALAAGCTTVNARAVEEQRAAGITRRYDRPPAELYQAAVGGLEALRDDPNWRGLEIVERDPARGVVIAQRNLDSALIPGLGEKDAIGVFVADAPGGDSDVTVVRLSSDQFPGDVGTTINTARDASGLLFPAIDRALASVREAPRVRIKSKNGSSVDAARLALDLERAGFTVDVEPASAR